MTSIKHPEDRFWQKVSIGKPTDCWLWVGAKKPRGYGNVRRNKVYTTAHRVSWELNFGAIPDGMQVQHSCDNPSCCNPYHLMLGTVVSNFVDMVKKGRSNCQHRNRKFGEDHPNNKLSNSQVDEIRAAYVPGKVRQVDLAKQYGVTQSAISFIILNKGRNHGKCE